MTRGAAEVGSAANSYEILAKLAAGGMAEIFLARGASVGNVERYVVLKRILRHRAGDAQLVRMFLDEARLAAQLQHANIAQVYDVGKLGDSFFFTMEYVHGETLRSLLHRSRALRRSLPLNCVLTIAAGAAAGLHYAHERVARDGRPLSIVHRDVSPSNLMVSFDGNVKIVDFGVAKAADRMVETRSGTVKGKISYLSPEQCKGGLVDRRCDLFALGIVMWEMLTTERLYRRATDFENMTAIVTEHPVPPSSRRSDVPPELDALVLRLLEKDRERRFQSGAELVEAIEQVAVNTASVLSTASVGRYLRELFGQRPEPWVELQSMEPHDGVTVTGEPVLADQAPPNAVDEQLAAVRELGVRHQLEASGKIAPPEPQPLPASIGQAPVTITVVAQSLENLVGAGPMAPTLIAPPIDDAGPPPMPQEMIPPIPVINPSGRHAQRQSGPQIPLTDPSPARTLPGMPGMAGSGPRASVLVTTPFDSPTTPFATPSETKLDARRRRMVILSVATLGVAVGIAAAVWTGTRPTGMPHDDTPPTPAPVAIELDATPMAVDAAIPAIVADAAPVIAVADAAPERPSCDVDGLRTKGTELVNMGEYAAGLAEFNKALACEPTLPMIRLAFMAACQAGDGPRARELFVQIPTTQQGNLAQICVRNKIDPTSAAPTPPPEPRPRRPEPPDLNRLFQQNRYADVVAACGNAPTGDRAAVCLLAACHVHDAVKAKKWLRAIPAAKRATTVAACHNAGTTLEQPPTPPATTHTTKPDAGVDCDPNDILSCQHVND